MTPKTPVHISSSQAETHFGELLQRVEAGEEIAITRSGKVVARLVPNQTAALPRPLGLLEGQWNLPDPEELIAPDPELEKLFYEDDG